MIDTKNVIWRNSTQSIVLFVHLVYYSQGKNIMVLDARIQPVPLHYHTWRKFPSSFVNVRNHTWRKFPSSLVNVRNHTWRKFPSTLQYFHQYSWILACTSAWKSKGSSCSSRRFARPKYNSVISTYLLNIQRHDQVVHISLIQALFTEQGFVPDIIMLPSNLSQCDMNKCTCLIQLARYRPTLVLQVRYMPKSIIIKSNGLW